MATAENHIPPEWADQARLRDLAWLDEHLYLLWSAAAAAFERFGRGALVVDNTSQPAPGLDQLLFYLDQEEIEACGNEKSRRMVRQYEPPAEFVLLALQSDNRLCSYRVRAQERPG